LRRRCCFDRIMPTRLPYRATAGRNQHELRVSCFQHAADRQPK